MDNKKNKWLSSDQIYQKISAFCAYQERCHSEVRSKLIQLGCFGDDLEQQIIRLIAEDFLNEERFAILYAQSKLRQKQWGKIKIDLQLKAKRISEYCRKKALNEIDDLEYQNILKKIITNKWNATAYNSEYERKIKTQQYAYRKGFEPEIIQTIFDNLYHTDSFSQE
ncbi:MAG: regulatory protein RecX [Saprospiraceae bacterium]|jgi:regulatory protein